MGGSAGAAAVLAHGIGGRRDLPIPFAFAVAGAAAALIISFVVLGVAWRDPRFDRADGGLALPRGLRAALATTLGYLVAHYLTLFVLEGQRVVIAISDPFSDGSDRFGTAGRGVNQSIASSTILIASIKVGAIVTGHTP